MYLECSSLQGLLKHFCWTQLTSLCYGFTLRKFHLSTIHLSSVYFIAKKFLRAKKSLPILSTRQMFVVCTSWYILLSLITWMSSKIFFTYFYVVNFNWLCLLRLGIWSNLGTPWNKQWRHILQQCTRGRAEDSFRRTRRAGSALPRSKGTIYTIYLAQKVCPFIRWWSFPYYFEIVLDLKK